MVWPAIIGAGAALLGGMINKSSQADTNRMNQENALRQEALQREFAQSGIQWKVEDAKKAGIHPLAALGANTVSYAPNVVGMGTDTSLGSAVASSGQDISRALEATRTREGRDGAFNKSVQDLTVTKMGLENELLATQIAKQKGQLGPAMPALTDTNAIPGQPATRSITLPGSLKVVTPGHETKQQDISDEYGDEGLPQVPGQIRFLRDTIKSWYKRDMEKLNKSRRPYSSGW